MTLYRTLALVALCALTAACGSSREQLAQRNSERCAARGLAPNSDAFNQCVTGLETERDSRMESRRLEMMERSGVPPSAMR